MGKIADSYVEIGVEDSKFQTAIKQVPQKIDEAAAKSKAAFSRAMLDVSRGIQDFAAAGLNGIVNNVEGIAGSIAKAMGASVQKASTLAGGLTIAAVGFQLLQPLLSSLVESTSRFFGLWQTESEKLKTSVTGLMGGGNGLRAMSEELQKQSEFLQNRTDKTGGWNIDFISRAVGFKGNEEKSIENNQRRATEAAALLARALETGAQASFEFAAAQRGAAAAFDLTTSQRAQTGMNKELFQAAVDKYGGGDNLRTKIQFEAQNQLGMKKTDARNLYGKFAMGDIAATNQVEKLLNLSTEKSKVLADDFEKATGAAEELAAIERQKAEKQKQFEAAALQRQQQETQKAAQDMQRLQEQQDAMAERREAFEQARNERQFNAANFQDLASARDNLFLAAKQDEKDKLTEKGLEKETDRVVKALDKIYEKFNMKMN